MLVVRDSCTNSHLHLSMLTGREEIKLKNITKTILYHILWLQKLITSPAIQLLMQSRNSRIEQIRNHSRLRMHIEQKIRRGQLFNRKMA